jgi:hypothetical protein
MIDGNTAQPTSLILVILQKLKDFAQILWLLRFEGPKSWNGK